MEPFCYIDGTIKPLSEAHVGVYDIGLLRGYGIYEAMSTANRKPFMFDDHMERFKRSTERLHLKIPIDDREVARVLEELIARNVPEGEAVIRFILTGGKASGGIDYDYETPTFYIVVEPLVQIDAKYYTEGATLMPYEHQRAIPECKTINYIQTVLLQDERKRQGALEILYSAGGEVLECATSNFFIVKNGAIATPKDKILLGITRKVVLRVADGHIPTQERAVLANEIADADEAFITSSFKHVVPVVRVGEHTIGTGAVGPVTKEVMRLYRECMIAQ